MIRLRRVDEPEELQRQRTIRLTEALLWPPAEDKQPDTEKNYEDSSVRVALARDTQKGLCAYCGASIETAGFDIEHFRPRIRYWWLTWTWENLWIACNTCQAKSDDFDLEESSPRLSPPTLDEPERAFEVWREQALLLDPAIDDPQEHLRVQPDDQGLWWWEAVPGSARGKHTREELHLQRGHPDRSLTCVRLQSHLNYRVKPRCDEVTDALSKGDDDHARQQWRALCREFLYRETEHLVPTWWYLHDFHLSNGLADHQMTMQAYPDENPTAQRRWTVRLWPDHLPDWLGDPRTRLLVLYARSLRKVPAERMSEVITAVRDCRPQIDDKALAELLKCSLKTIKRRGS